MVQTLSVASYNLYLGADLSLVLGDRPAGELALNLSEVQRQLLATSFPDRARHIAQALVERQVDLVGLQEACCWTLAGEQLWDFTALLQQELAARGADYEIVTEVATFEGDGELSIEGRSAPIHLRGSNVTLRRLHAAVRVVEECHGLFDEAHRVHSLGTRSITIDRGWCGVRCDLGGTEFAFVNTHTEAYDVASRARQRDELLDVCASMELPMVLVGDFNETPDLVGMPGDLTDAWSVNGYDPGYTCCQGPDLTNVESTLDERIDYIWVRGGRVLSATRLGVDEQQREQLGMWPSDHAGLHAQVELG